MDEKLGIIERMLLAKRPWWLLLWPLALADWLTERIGRFLFGDPFDPAQIESVERGHQDQ